MLKPTRLFSAMQPTVFLGSACLVIGFVGLGVGWPDLAQRVFQAIQSGIIEHFGWLYVLGASALLVFVLVILFSRFRDIRLGGLDAEPEFSYLSWFAMMFSAGMGTGLVYWGVAEPMMYWMEPPFATSAGESEFRQAMRLTFATGDSTRGASTLSSASRWPISIFATVCLWRRAPCCIR